MAIEGEYKAGFNNLYPSETLIGIKGFYLTLYQPWDEVIPDSLPAGYYNFVVTSFGNHIVSLQQAIFVLSRLPLDVGSNHLVGHDKLANGKEVYTAGKLFFNQDAEISEMSNWTGHYKTSFESLLIAESFLQACSAPFSGDFLKFSWQISTSLR